MTVELRTFRFVCDETEVHIVEELLRAQGFDFEPEPFYGMARKLTREPFPLGESLAARFGRIYIQDRSSMLPPLMLAPPKGASVLDMCSAPGSKTSLLSMLVGKDGFVFASEPSSDRLGVLRANLRKMSCVNTASTKMLAQELTFPDNSWDYIQLDPPCSGWGTLDKNPKAKELWSDSKIPPLVALQKALLERAVDMLAPGGVVLFSTCTTNIEENEEQVAWALEHLDVELEPLEPPKGFVFGEPLLPNMQGVLRVDEDSDGQGFFLARFRKKGDTSATDVTPVQKKELPGRPLNLPKMQGGKNISLASLPSGVVYEFGSKVFFLHEEALDRVPASLRWQGAFLGKIAGKGDRAKFVPDGMARALLPKAGAKGAAENFNTDDVASVNQLLIGQSLSFQAGKGPVGLYFKGLPLCWLARKGKRIMMLSK